MIKKLNLSEIEASLTIYTDEQEEYRLSPIKFYEPKNFSFEETNHCQNFQDGSLYTFLELEVKRIYAKEYSTSEKMDVKDFKATKRLFNFSGNTFIISQDRSEVWR